MPIQTALKKFFKGEIIDEPALLTPYSKDASIFEITPQLVLCPHDPEDVKALINYINDNPQENLTITPRSAGTDMSGGAINDGLILDMTKHFNNILEIGEDFAKVQPGVFYRDFEVESLKQNLILPCFTASKDLCTVGGMVANNSAGERTLTYGQTEKYVKRLKVIFSNGAEYEIKPLNKKQLQEKIFQKDFEGTIYREVLRLIEDNRQLIRESQPNTSKNSTGYLLWKVWDGVTFDLTKLIVGSQGTLGIITEIEFELVKPKPKNSLLVINLYNINHLDEIVNQVLQFNPQAFEVYDDQTINYSLKFLSELAGHFKLNNRFETFLHFLPERIESWFNSLPKLVLLAQFAGDTEEEVATSAHDANKSLSHFNLHTRILTTDKSSEKYWVTRHESFSMLRHHAVHMRSAPFIDDITVKPKDLPQFLPKLNSIIERYKNQLGHNRFIYTLAGHIGDGNFHIIPLIDIADSKVKEALPVLMDEVFRLTFEYHGSMSAEHNDGLVRGPYLENMYGSDMYQLFKKVKEIFDPKGIFNPHKKADATFEYSYKHLSRT
jgi:FAD/FMN-containing dehydrogenase